MVKYSDEPKITSFVCINMLKSSFIYLYWFKVKCGGGKGGGPLWASGNFKGLLKQTIKLVMKMVR